MSKGLSKQQLRVLAFVWVGVVIAIGACVFLGILAALRAQEERQQAVVTPATSAEEQSVQPTPLPADPEDVPAAATIQPTLPPNQDPAFGYGIQTQLHVNTEGTLDQIEQLGLNWVKFQVRWADLEPVQGQPSWDALDAIFAATSQRNIKVLVNIVAAPDWARSVTADGFVGPPDDPQTYVNYVSQFLQRYRGAVHAIEVWNEPNLSERGWYTAGGLSSADYLNLLIPTAQTIRAIDPNVIIISAALSPTGVDDGVIAINDFRYLRELIDQGMLNYVDCVGAHANGINLPPDLSAEEAYAQGAPPGTLFIGPYDRGNPANPHPSWSFYSTLNGYHDIIVASGGSTPLCVTEFGWASLEGMEGEPLLPDFGFAYDNSLQEQADNIVRAFELMHDWGFVKLAILFNLDYSPKNGGDPKIDATMFSIVNPDGSPRPAFEAVMAMDKPS